MFDMKYLIIASIQLTKNKLELDDKIKNLPGVWDVIYPDGTLSSVSNKSTDKNLCSKNIIKLAYIKTTIVLHLLRIYCSNVIYLNF